MVYLLIGVLLMVIKQNFLPRDCLARPGLPLNRPTSITIHWVGPYPGQTPEVVRNWWIQSKGEAGAHYIVKDDNVLQCIPEQEVAWHCGCHGNYSSIGIEVIPFNKEGLFSQASIDSVIELLKRLPKVRLMRHYDWTKKDCPRYYIDEKKWIALYNELDLGRKEI